MLRFINTLFIVFGFTILSATSQIHSVMSPDKTLTLNFYQENTSDGLHVYYDLKYRNEIIVRKSELSIVLDNHISELAMAIKPDADYRFVSDMDFVSRTDTSVNNIWNNKFGERSVVVDNYNQASFLFEKKGKKGYRLQIDFRVYNKGIAFRYHFPLNPKGLYYRVVEENSEFVMPQGTKAWYHRWAQAPFELLPLENWIDECERPLTCVLPNGFYVALAEAQMVDYSRTKFKIKPNQLGTIQTSLWAPVDAITPFSTPWRANIVAQSAKELVESNDLILNLNQACAIENTDWIRPGKIMREIAQTNENSKACIDFAAENGIDYILYDWKWYGNAFDFNSDASTVAIDLDLKKWIEYGKQRGVGIWLYVNQQALLKQMREIFPIYRQWGIAGVKYGFVQVGAQYWSNWLHESIKLAADNQLMVNIHDEFRTTGENRTFPNMLTVEGIRGNEEFPDATHNTILPFTRYIGGVGDYTICYMDKRLKTTHAHQLALGVIYFSPLQTVYWYDKPSALDGVPEVSFFKELPTVWDDTRIIGGKIGEYVIVARRAGNRWFVGAITNNDARVVEIPLNFLDKMKKYTANTYADNPKLNTKTQIEISQKKVNEKSVLKFNLQPSGGVAFWIDEVLK